MMFCASDVNTLIRTVRRAVDYQSLTIAAQEDIAVNLIDHSDYLTSQHWNETELRELLVDVIEPIQLFISEKPLAPLVKQAAACAVSDFAVKRLQETLATVGNLDPVIVDGDSFIDGRHRVDAYARAGRTMIPTVDIGPLLRLDWDRWINGGLQ